MNSYYGVSGLSESEMKRLYLVGMRPFMNTRALFSDLTDDYVYPSEPEPYSIIRIRFRTARNNADHVFYVSNGEKVLMDKVETSGNFDYYSIEIELDDTPVRYHFYIETGKMSVFYDRRGVTRDEQPFFDFRVIPGFSVPEWSRSAVIYQIYVGRLVRFSSSAGSATEYTPSVSVSFKMRELSGISTGNSILVSSGIGVGSGTGVSACACSDSVDGCVVSALFATVHAQSNTAASKNAMAANFFIVPPVIIVCLFFQ